MKLQSDLYKGAIYYTASPIKQAVIKVPMMSFLLFNTSIKKPAPLSHHYTFPQGGGYVIQKLKSLKGKSSAC